MKPIKASFDPECERLTVHLAHAIQPSGVFMALVLPDLVLRLVSANCEAELGLPVLEAIGQPAATLLSPDSLEVLRELLATPADSGDVMPAVLALELRHASGQLLQRHAMAYRTGDLLCIEAQHTLPDQVSNRLVPYASRLRLQALRAVMQRSVADKAELAGELCRALRALTGYQRVYYCEFYDDGAGYVVADDAVDPLPSLRHHHFPASDLPMVVRQLYLRNRFRMIADARYEAVAILGLEAPIDLSASFLRAVGGTHLKYLHNMDIRASASFSVVEGETLRGLVGCHSTVPHALPLSMLGDIQSVVEVFASRLLTLRYQDLVGKKDQASVALVKFAAAFEGAGFRLEQVSTEALSEIGQVFHASVVLCRSGDHITTSQSLPEPLTEHLLTLAETWLTGRSEVIATDCLTDLDPDLTTWCHLAAGMLLLPLDHERRSFMAFLRPEILQQRQWGGDPTHSLRDRNQKLTPRNSFATWIEQVQGRCEPWTAEQQRLARELHTQLLDLRSSYLSKVEVINQELSKKSRENETLLGEVHHRVKNNLAIVNSIFEWKISETPDPRLAQELREMKGRVRAIASLHQTLYQGQDFGHLNLSRLMRSISNEALLLLKDYKALIRFEIDVPEDVSIDVAEALPIGLIAHEFITNSIKYAFVGRNHGTVRIAWVSEPARHVFSIQDDGCGRADIADLTGSSLGLQMMRLLIGQLDATADWNGHDGVSLKMYLPRKDS